MHSTDDDGPTIVKTMTVSGGDTALTDRLLRLFGNAGLNLKRLSSSIGELTKSWKNQPVKVKLTVQHRTVDIEVQPPEQLSSLSFLPNNNELSSPPEKDINDFDMFALDDAPPVHKSVDVPLSNDSAFLPLSSSSSQQDVGLAEECDDAEGYYKYRIGEIIGTYAVTKFHGKGSFGIVLEAIDQRPEAQGCKVAIKMAKNQEIIVKTGLREIDVMKKINQSLGIPLSAYTPTSSTTSSLFLNGDEMKSHSRSRIVRYFGSFYHKNHLCIVLENLSSNLRTVLEDFGKGIGLSVRAVQEYTRNMCVALHRLCRLGFIHSDIKPDNILLQADNRSVSLCDFGSCIAEKQAEVAPYLGSRFYRAPEAILGSPPTPAIDMWSLGCTVYELATGKVLFPGGSNNDMLRLILAVRGAFPKKMLQKGDPQVVAKYFDPDGSFLQFIEDPVTHRMTTKKIPQTKPEYTVHDLLYSAFYPSETPGGPQVVPPSREEEDLLQKLTLFIEQCLTLNPLHRLTAEQALSHPFIAMPRLIEQATGTEAALSASSLAARKGKPAAPPQPPTSFSLAAVQAPVPILSSSTPADLPPGPGSAADTRRSQSPDVALSAPPVQPSPAPPASSPFPHTDRRKKFGKDQKAIKTERRVVGAGLLAMFDQQAAQVQAQQQMLQAAAAPQFAPTPTASLSMSQQSLPIPMPVPTTYTPQSHTPSTSSSLPPHIPQSSPPPISIHSSMQLPLQLPPPQPQLTTSLPSQIPHQQPLPRPIQSQPSSLLKSKSTQSAIMEALRKAKEISAGLKKT